jgi:hypothetical protein
MTRMLWQALSAVLVAYAFVLALVYLFQSRLVYFPETGRSVAATPQAYGLRFEPVTIATEDNERLAAWWVPAENALGAVSVLSRQCGQYLAPPRLPRDVQPVALLDADHRLSRLRAEHGLARGGRHVS